MGTIFNENYREYLEKIEINLKTGDGGYHERQIFELKPFEAAEMFVQVGAGPTKDVNRFPPRFQSLIGHCILMLNQKNQTFFKVRAEKLTRFKLSTPRSWRELGEDVFPIKAELLCRNNKVFIEIFSGVEEEYQWQINVTGTRYKGDYQYY